MNEVGYYVTRIEEEHLWEAKQLGAHSPQVLLNTLVYFDTKYFMLRTVEDHQKLSFTHIMKHWKKAPGQKEGQKSVILRYYPPAKKGKMFAAIIRKVITTSRPDRIFEYDVFYSNHIKLNL